MTAYTLVQHSGFVVNADPSFEHAVELTAITAAQASKIIRAGGLIFNSYEEASNREEQENYPPDVTGLIPRAPGKFGLRINGSRLYIP